MYKVNNPIRVVQQSNEIYLLSIPRKGLRIEINKNVLEFIELMQSKEEINNTIIDEYVGLNQIENKDDYIILFNQMVSMGIIREI